MKNKIASEGAEVIVHGKYWDEANAFALKLAKEDPSNISGEIIHPFDDPDIWKGHSSIIHEIYNDMQNKQQKPSLIIR
jgi:L-serine/L-threonine ammonia-lyase